MLSAFTPRQIINFRDRDKSKIESVLAHGDRVFVGLNTGSLRIYGIDHSIENQGTDAAYPRPAELRQEVEKFSRKSVQQLSVVRDAGILVSLSDGYVSLHDLETYALTERLENTKGASSFAVIRNIVNDAETGIPSVVSRLAVAIKRKLIVWTWKDSEILGPGQEFTVLSTIKSLTWSEVDQIVVGMDSGFSVVHVEKKTSTDVMRNAEDGEDSAGASGRFGVVNTSGMGYVGMGSWIPKPLSAKLWGNELLLAKDVNSLFIDNNGISLNKRQIPWTTAPESIGYSYPYLITLLAPSSGMLELRNPQTLSLLQSIALPGAFILHVPQPNISLAHAGKGFLVASGRCVWRMEAISYGPQIDELVNNFQFDEALSLISLIEDTLLLDKDQRIQDIKVKKARRFFDQRKYREAMALFLEAKAEPRQVIALFPQSIAGGSSSEDGFVLEEEKPVGQEEIQQNQSSPNKPSNSNSVKSKNRKSIHKANQASDTASIRSGVSSNDIRGESHGQIRLAVHELTGFLVETRKYLERYLNFDGTLKLKENRNIDAKSKTELSALTSDGDIKEEDLHQRLLETATLVDTTLFRAYMLINPPMAGPLARRPNFCSPEVIEKMLYSHGRYSELKDFLYGKGMHERALELLQEFGKSESNDEMLNDFHGPEKTAEYLQQLPPEEIDLILKFVDWPLREDPDLGMAVFLGDTQNAESLPRNRVVSFLLGLDVRYAMTYLEHIIDELGDETAEFHDQLIELYLQQLLKTPNHQDSYDLELQTKLEKMLKRGAQFDTARLLKQMPTGDDRFFESRATVLGKIHHHKEALQIYIFQMHDNRRAIEYCNQVYLDQADYSSRAPNSKALYEPESIYAILLSLYLSPPSAHKQDLNAALDLLSSHGSRLSTAKTLSILPTSLSIKDLELYFQARMRATVSLTREAAIVASLSSAERSALEYDLLIGKNSGLANAKTSPEDGRSRRIILGENRLCNVCQKRFGKAAARVSPKGDVVHYGCSGRTAVI